MTTATRRLALVGLSIVVLAAAAGAYFFAGDGRAARKENAKGAGYNIAVELKATIPGLELAQAQDLVHKAHQICPYSNATRGNVDVTLTVIDAALAAA